MGGIQSFERNTDQAYGRTKITETANFDFRKENIRLSRKIFCINNTRQLFSNFSKLPCKFGHGGYLIYSSHVKRCSM